jgi:hypothetical protein
VLKQTYDSKCEPLRPNPKLFLPAANHRILRSPDDPISPDHPMFYHSPAFISFLIFRLIKSRLSTLKWLM